MGIFVDDWEGSSADDVFTAYRVSVQDKALVDEILYASYTYQDYNGESHVIYRGIDGLLYEVFGSHCSCYGLEGQWDAEETSVEYYIDCKDRGAYVDSDILIALGIN